MHIVHVYAKSIENESIQTSGVQDAFKPAKQKTHSEKEIVVDQPPLISIAFSMLECGINECW